VPAVLGISQDTFIVYTSNVFAILGLRALFFLIEGILERLPGLRAGLALVLAFVGLKMAAHPLGFDMGSGVSLAVILSLLVGSSLVARFLARGEKERDRGAPPDPGGAGEGVRGGPGPG